VRPGQSLVEFAILLPLLLMMLSGLIEFGFALNVYLDLVDVSREVARFSADDDPIHDDASGVFEDFNEQFYLRAANMAAYTLGQAGQVTLDPRFGRLGFHSGGQRRNAGRYQSIPIPVQ